MTDTSQFPVPNNGVSAQPVDTLLGTPLTSQTMPGAPTTTFDPAGPADQQVPGVAAPGQSDPLAGGGQVTVSPQMLSDRTTALTRLYPGLKNDSKTLSSLASLQITDDDLFGSVGQLHVASQAQTQAQILSMLDAPDRWKRWQSLSKQSQQLILESTSLPAPAQPNPTPAGHKSFWDQLGSSISRDIFTAPKSYSDVPGWIGRGAVSGTGDLISGVSHAVGTDVVGPAAQAVGLGGPWKTAARQPGNVMQFPGHAYRNEVALNQAFQQGGTSAVLNPSTLSRSWEETAPGKPFYNPSDLSQAKNLVGGNQDKYDLAVATAQSGGDITQGVLKMLGPAPANPTAAYTARVSQLQTLAQSDPNFTKAVKQIQSAGVSPGRDTARVLGLQEGSIPYQAVSGATDAAWSWYSNPGVVAGRFSSLAKASRAVDASSVSKAVEAARLPEEANATVTAGDTTSRSYFPRLATLNVGGGGLNLGSFSGPDTLAAADTASRRRGLIAIADHYNQGNAMGYMSARPADAKAFSAFNEYAKANLTGTVTPNDVLDWLDSGAGSSAIASGQFASYLTNNDYQLPRLSKAGALAVGAKVAATPLGRIAADLPLAEADVAPTQQALAKKGLLGTLVDSPYKTAELFRSGLFDGQVVLAGPDASPSFARYVRQYLLPSNQRDQLVNAFASAPNMAVRRDIVRQASEAGFRAQGLTASEAGQNWVDSQLQGMRENYSPAGRDVLPDGHRDTLTPDLEEASAMKVPTLKEVWQAGREANTLGVVKSGLTNPAFETMMHRYWAPLALLRAGEAPRLVGEEWLTALMRLQPGQVASGYAASWLPRIAERMGALSGIEASNPVSKFGAYLAARAGGMADDLALNHLSPEMQQASQQLAEARGLKKEQKGAYRQIAELDSKRAELASSLSENHPQVQEATADLEAKMADMRELGDRMARNQLVKNAYGKVFGTGGGFLQSMGSTGDLLSVDGQYQPVVNVAMRGHFRPVGRNDPAFKVAAAEYLGKFGRSPLLRSGLDAISGYTPDATAMTSLRSAFAGSSLEGGSDAELLANVRAAYHSAPPEVQEALRYYQKASAVGGGMVSDAGGALRDMHIRSDPKWKDRPEGSPTLTAEHRDLIDRTLGAGNFRPRVKVMADEDLGNVKDKGLAGTLAAYRKTKSANVKNRLAVTIGDSHPDRVYHDRPEQGGPLASDHVAAMFGHPDREPITSARRAATVAEDAMVRHMHSPAFAPYIPKSGHLQYDLAEPVPDGHTRLYYPAASPSWQPGDLNLDAIDNPQLKADVAATVLNRKRLSTVIDQATENPTHQAIGLWAHPNPFRAERVAQHLAGDDSAVGYADVPNVLADAQRYENPSIERLGANHPRLADATEAKDVTERTSARMGSLGGNLQGYRLSEEQQVLGHLLKDGHEVLPDGTWANGRSLEENIRTMAAKAAADLVDAFVHGGKFLHGPAHDLLSQDPKTLRFDSNHLVGVADSALPETVSAPVKMLVKRPTGAGAALDRLTLGGWQYIGAALESMVRSEAMAVNLAKGLRAAKVVEPYLVDQDLRSFGQDVASKVGVHPSDLRHALDLAHETGIRGGDMSEYPDEQALIEQAQAHDPDGRLPAYAEMEGRVDDHLNQIANERAVNDTLPFVNNHNARSNMSEYLRNVSPFFWAQESMLKRWVRSAAYNPATFSRLELGLHGLAATGNIHKDEYGNSVITIPGSGALMHSLSDIGVPYQVAATIPFTMEVNQLTPGVAHPFTPPAGPIITVPLDALMGSQPEASALASSLGVPQSNASVASRMFGELVPAGWARNTLMSVISNPQSLASARLAAQQSLIAAGHGPTPGSPARERELFEQRVTRQTRNAGILQGLLGFFTPATPHFDLGAVKTPDGQVQTIAKDLDADIKMFGPTDGYVEWLKTHPDDGPYTVAQTSSTGGGTVPATQAALDMIDANPGFFEDHPYGGAYLLPQAPGNFDRKAYNTELSTDLRVKKGWDTLTMEQINAAASETYYQQHDQYLKALSQFTADPAAQSAIKKAWTSWSQNFQQSNPMFAEQLNSSTASATRATALADVRSALASGDTPNPQAASQIAGLLNLYDYWVQVHQTLATNTTAGVTDRRRQVDAAFAQGAAQYVAGNPLAAQFYSRLIVPEIAAQDQTLGKALEASNL